MTTTDEIRRWATALPAVEESSHFRFHVPIFKVQGRTFLGMGRDETTAVFCISEPAADEASAADPSTYEAVRRRDSRRSFLGLQVQLDNIGSELVHGLVEQAWRQQAPRQLVAEHDRTAPPT
jgi:hypothetical protein